VELRVLAFHAETWDIAMDLVTALKVAIGAPDWHGGRWGGMVCQARTLGYCRAAPGEPYSRSADGREVRQEGRWLGYARPRWPRSKSEA
jgi:hypothetical protein